MSDEIVDRAHDFLRSHLAGRIRFDGDAIAIKVVVSPDGRLAAPVMVAMLRSVETVLELPDDAEQSLHLMVSLEAFDEHGPEGGRADRWRIYHGDPPDVRWAVMRIDAARFEGHFIDGEALERPNELAALEPMLLRRLNHGDRALLRRACDSANLASEAPVAVGIDERGIDVRRAFEVVRLRFPEPLSANSLDASAAATDARAEQTADAALRAVERSLSPS